MRVCSSQPRTPPPAVARHSFRKATQKGGRTAAAAEHDRCHCAYARSTGLRICTRSARSHSVSDSLAVGVGPPRRLHLNNAFILLEFREKVDISGGGEAR
eukprot:4582273-Pyramimonas_sp.AAC.1